MFKVCRPMIWSLMNIKIYFLNIEKITEKEDTILEQTRILSPIHPSSRIYQPCFQSTKDLNPSIFLCTFIVRKQKIWSHKTPAISNAGNY